MDIGKLIGGKTSVPSIDFNQVVKSDNLRYWRISNATWEKDKVIVHINNVSKMIGSKRIKLSEGTTIHIQNELVLALKELED